MNQNQFSPPSSQNVREPRRSNVQKTKDILKYMHNNCNRFSLHLFLETLFNSDDGDLRKSANMFLKSGKATTLLNEWVQRIPNEEMEDWIMGKAAKLCIREFSWLTDRASQGPHEEDAKFLRVSSDGVNVALLEEFQLKSLTARYDRTMPHFQHLLLAVIGKDADESQGDKSQVRDINAGRTLITSTALNLRSRLTNYHGVINALTFWKNRLHKRVHQSLNKYGISVSYHFVLKAVHSLSYDALRLARAAAADETKVKGFVYDNFNWVSRVWEASALHGNVTHDEVSAILLVLPHGDVDASHIASHARFRETFGNRHMIPAIKALHDISPSSDDIQAFRTNAILHIKYILADEVKCFKQFRSSLPKFDDPKALMPIVTEEYCLPTFDQEQGSTRGNMIVLEHYFLKVFKLPVAVFERVMYFVIGDRLTTARDRAAQDQRSVDRSPNAIDRLAPFSMANGLMHSCLNYIDNLGRNAWGSGTADDVSLLTLRDKLPNRSSLNLRKIDYYAWLRFYDDILRALVIKAAMTVLGITSTLGWENYAIDSMDDFSTLCSALTDQFLLPSLSHLEAANVKTLPGNTVSGHAVLLMHDLMLLREMRHAIKHGHPTRILRIIRFWTPMFYAGGSYNYSNEFMELLHNMVHDWPADSAQVVFNGMLVNCTGKHDGWKECDLRNEHLNNDIKAHAHGPNVTPENLEKITPALGHIGKLTDHLFLDLGVEEQNQYHAKVAQHKDAEILVNHFVKGNIFDFKKDRKSDHSVIDLFRFGQRRLSGPDGGHAKHLARHRLRLRTRNVVIPDSTLQLVSPDRGPDYIEHSLNEEDDEIRDVIQTTDDRAVDE